MDTLNQLDEETKKLLTLNNFLDGLTVPEFIEKLSKNLDRSTQHGDGIEQIDPKPYIRTFEATLKELNKLREECSTRKSKLEKMAAIKQSEHYVNVLNLAPKAQQLNKRFAKLEVKVDDISTNIRPLGDKLTKTNNLKENTVSLIFLTKCYNEFYTNGKPPAGLMTPPAHEMVKTAVTLTQLVKLSSNLVSNDLPRSKECSQLIQDHCKKFELGLLEQFHKYYNLKDYGKLSQLASVLSNFNDGENVVNFFINKHEIFSQFQDEELNVGENYWWDLSNPDFDNFKLDEVTLRLFGAFEEIVYDEFDSVKQIFEQNSKKVIVCLLDRFYNELVYTRVQYLLKVSLSFSKLSNLRMLHLLSSQLFQLTKKLKTFFTDKELDIAMELDRFQTLMFQQYLDKDAYFGTEKENLLELIEALTTKFEMKNENIIQKHLLENKVLHFKDSHAGDAVDYEKDQDGAINFVQDQPTPQRENSTKRLLSYSKKSRKLTSISNFIKNMERTSSLKDKFSKSKLRTATLNNSIINNVANRHSRHISETNISEPTLDHTDGSELSLIVAEKILKYVVESLTRSIELVPSKINEYSMEIFDLLLENFGHSYVAIGMESLYHHGILMQQQKLTSFFGSNSNELNLSFLDQLNLISLQVYLFSVVVKRFFYPLILSDVTKNKLSLLFNSYLQDVEIGINIILDELLDLVERNMKTILNNQSADDFQPINANQPSIDKTETCDKLIKFTDKVFRSLYEYLSFNPVLKFEIIKRILSTLLNLLIMHFTKFKINSTGSLTVTQDIIHYVSIFDSYEGLENMKESFSILRELTNLFSCQPELLKDLCHEGKLIYLKKNLLKLYISKRSDFNEKFLIGI